MGNVLKVERRRPVKRKIWILQVESWRGTWGKGCHDAKKGVKRERWIYGARITRMVVIGF